MKLLWLSDIHLDGMNLKRNTQNLIDSFVKKLKDFDNIDVLVISGDIAKNGESEKHYDRFKEKILEPIKGVFSDVKIILVPGNHDVNWEKVNSEFMKAIKNNGNKEFNINDYKSNINKNYYPNVFQWYYQFHKNNADNEHTNTFSNIFPLKEQCVVFVNLNSAWLSVGKPLNKTKYRVRVTHRMESYEIVQPNEDKLIFQELGNQTYGFTCSKVIKDQLDSIQNELINDYNDYFKILVVHHPPNNWICWEELYSSKINDKGVLNKFILDTNIRLILSGHEHTSLVEGGVLYGAALDLKAGMFLDHKQEEYGTSWFKILDINKNKTKIVESSYNYDSGNEKWEEMPSYKFSYKNWDNVCSKFKQNDSKSVYSNLEKKITEEGIKDKISEVEFKSFIDNSNLTDEALDSILSLVKFSKENKSNIDKNIIKVSKNDSYLYVISNIDDFFGVFKGEIEKKGYIYSLLEGSDVDIILKDLDELTSYDNVFMFYMYEIKDDSKIEQMKIEKIVRRKFEHYRDQLFRVDKAFDLLKNANIAVRNINA